ncbi:primase-helicase family protein [Spirabiliibacterium mucosae]|uniref:primase-helicase family protein n=1 Tax=Spirabiliibacterium mucosae TaxID=28156 RepID=UPI001F1D817D|nr:primase-helicase family protein [Spirabiliibacterium mucosae]
MQVDFHGAGVPLCKTFLANETRPYPLAKKLTTYRESVNNLQEYADAIRKHAALGHWLYKGATTKELNNESRKGLTDIAAPTRILVLDIDGLSLDIPGMIIKGAFNADKLKTVAEAIVNNITGLSNVSYVACASSSCGLVDDARLHLHFFLDAPVAPKSLKMWLQELNLSVFSAKLKLNPSGASLKWIVDPCLADNSRGIFIAPPKFEGVENPFADNADRVIYVKKSRETAYIADQIANIDPEQLHQKTEQRIDELYKSEGLKREKPKLRSMQFNGQPTEVVDNPKRISMHYSYHNDRFAYYNIGPHGDSNAYYVYLDNPTVVFNFKGEEPFMFAAADKATYEEHCERFKNATIKSPTVVKRPLAFLEDGTNYLLLLHSQEENAIVAEEITRDKTKAELWFNNYGFALPEAVPPAQRRFNPTTNQVFQKDPTNGYTYVNTFRPSKYMKETYESPVPGVSYENATLLQYACPTLYKIIHHMLGCDDKTICHFLNWFAFIFQRRIKPETCWVLQGTQGTGKGAFYRNVCRPLWGEKYAFEKQLQNFEDDKNGWEQYAMLVLIDEVNMKHSRSDKSSKHC